MRYEGDETLTPLEGDITPDNIASVNYIRFESSEPATPPVRNASVTAKTESTSKKLNELAEGRIDTNIIKIIGPQGSQKENDYDDSIFFIYFRL